MHIYYDPMMLFAGFGGGGAGKELKNAAADADARAKQAAKEVSNAQAGATKQAQAGLDSRRRAQIVGSQSIYTSPLGLAGSANIARKTLLGQ